MTQIFKKAVIRISGYQGVEYQNIRLSGLIASRFSGLLIPFSIQLSKSDGEDTINRELRAKGKNGLSNNIIGVRVEKVKKNRIVR